MYSWKPLGTLLQHWLKQVWVKQECQLHALFTLSLLRVINVKFPLQPHQRYFITHYEDLGFSQLTQMRNDFLTNSHNLTYTLSLTNVGRMYFLSIGVKGLKHTGHAYIFFCLLQKGMHHSLYNNYSLKLAGCHGKLVQWMGKVRDWYCTVTVLCCAVLYCTVLCCAVLCCAVLYCTVLYCAVLCCTVLCCTVLCCAVLYCAVLCCTVLYCAVLYCTVL